MFRTAKDVKIRCLFTRWRYLNKRRSFHTGTCGMLGERQSYSPNNFLGPAETRAPIRPAAACGLHKAIASQPAQPQPQPTSAWHFASKSPCSVQYAECDNDLGFPLLDGFGVQELFRSMRVVLPFPREYPTLFWGVLTEVFLSFSCLFGWLK